MKAMGIPVWLPRALTTESEPENTSSAPLEAPPPEPPPPQEADYAAALATQPAKTAPPAELQQLFDAPTPPPVAQPRAQPDAEPALQPVATLDCSAMDWSALQAAVQDCSRCRLHQNRTQTVFGVGDQQARWMIIGEAPGAEEDRRGEPFVGRAGQLLDNMLRAIQVSREQVYIANTLKCRPPNNRDPKADEAAHCWGYLQRQIALVQPQLIVVVGRIAAQTVLQTKTPLGRLRGKLHRLPDADIPVIVTYHPAYLLRQPSEKRKAWQDLQLVCQTAQALPATR